MNICGKIRKPLLSGRTCFKPVSDEFFTNSSLTVLFKKNILLGNKTLAIERAKELEELSIKNVAALVTALPVLYTCAPMYTVQLFTYTLHLYTCTVHLCTNCTSVFYILPDILLYWIFHCDTDRYDDVSVPLGCRVWPPCSAASFSPLHAWQHSAAVITVHCCFSPLHSGWQHSAAVITVQCWFSRQHSGWQHSAAVITVQCRFSPLHSGWQHSAAVLIFSTALGMATLGGLKQIFVFDQILFYIFKPTYIIIIFLYIFKPNYIIIIFLDIFKPTSIIIILDRLAAQVWIAAVK